MTRIGGAMLITFYRGVKVKMLSFHINLFNQRNGGGAVHSSHSGGRLFLVGAMLAFFNNASYALWPIIQAKNGEIESEKSSREGKDNMNNGGEILITFYRGVEIKMLSFHINLFNQ
ncbi:WAT1-related protein [Arachis hypogaea]|nr:WAT1-related protein [Arachis hypogaea]